MKLRNIHGCSNIDAYVEYKLALYSEKEKNFETLFELMFDESENIMVETTDGYRVKKTTYGAFKQNILAVVPTVAEAFSDLQPGGMVGLYMANCPEWLTLFWAILAAGYRPLLMNTRLPDQVLSGILDEYGINGVISDGKTFPVKTIMKEQALIPSDKELPSRPFGTEVLFMSSGTTNRVKLCAYTGENFYYQICDSGNIVKTCPDIKRHYEGELKQLVLLPLCHVFGFTAVYLWFGFFSRTFVFPKDLNPDTIQRTVKKHKVTHIFAVPMVWDAVAKAAVGKIKSRGEKTYRRFQRGIRIVNSFGRCGDLIAKKLLAEVREALFGDSITCLVSGGSEISSATLQFFNGIGYHLANGYGMTEIGITSVEKTSKKKILNSGTIGAPFGYTEYMLDDNGCLLVRGKTRAARILCDGTEAVAQADQWFATGDVMRCHKGRYFAQGRSDDLIICEDGENLNPLLVEKTLLVEGIDKLCVFADANKQVAVVASIPGCYDKNRLQSIYEALSEAVVTAKLEKVVRRIYFTGEPLLGPGDFKLSRKKIAQRIHLGELKVYDPKNAQQHVEELFEGFEEILRDCFAEALGKEADQIGKDSHFFRDLGGTSMEYYTLTGLIQRKFGVTIISDDASQLATISAFAAYLKKQ